MQQNIFTQRLQGGQPPVYQPIGGPRPVGPVAPYQPIGAPQPGFGANPPGPVMPPMPVNPGGPMQPVGQPAPYQPPMPNGGMPPGYQNPQMMNALRARAGL
jgi:hypothetical protein